MRRYSTGVVEMGEQGGRCTSTGSECRHVEGKCLSAFISVLEWFEGAWSLGRSFPWLRTALSRSQYGILT